MKIKAHRGLLQEAGLQPLPHAPQVQVDAHQAQLPPALDQLIRLHHQALQEDSGNKRQGEASLLEQRNEFAVTNSP